MFNLALLAGTVPDPANYPVPEGAWDKLMYGLQVTLVGLGTVFFVLFLLMFIVYIFKIIFYTIPQKRAKNATTADVPETPVAVAPVTVEDDEEIAAVIAAAIEGFYGGNVEARQKYRIRSFKRI